MVGEGNDPPEEYAESFPVRRGLSGLPLLMALGMRGSAVKPPPSPSSGGSAGFVGPSSELSGFSIISKSSPTPDKELSSEAASDVVLGPTCAATGRGIG